MGLWVLLRHAAGGLPLPGSSWELLLGEVDPPRPKKRVAAAFVRIDLFKRVYKDPSCTYI